MAKTPRTPTVRARRSATPASRSRSSNAVNSARKGQPPRSAGPAASASSTTGELAASMRDEVQAFKRERILEVAADLFYEQGYQQATLEQVARRLGVTKPVLYNHFRNKGEILAEISRRGIANGNEALREALAGAGPVAVRLETAIRSIVRTILASQRHTALFFREHKNFEPALREPLEAMHREFDALLAQLLEAGIRSGEFHIPDVRLCSLALGGMVNWAYTWYRANGRLSADALADGLATLALQTVGVTRS